MPGGDGTGPAGMGPMTGRGFGYCSGTEVAGFRRRGFGWGGFRGGRRGGRGWRNQFYATGLTGWQRAAMDDLDTEAGSEDKPQDQKLAALEQQMENLSAMMEDIRSRLDQLRT